jgi:hypothetical protein
MIRLDSNKMQFTFDCINHIKKVSFKHTETKERGQLIVDRYSIDKPIPGVKNIVIDNIHKTVTVDTSAKILKDNYLQGVNINTISQVFDTINETGLIDINTKSAIETGRYLNIDICNNVTWNDSKISECIEALNIGAINPTYKVDRFNSKHNRGIVFTGNQKTKKVRLIVYDKQIELQQAKNRMFLKSCRNPIVLLNSARNILRCETNNTSHREIRKRLNIQNINILSVLNSKATPTVSLFENIMSAPTSEQIELFAKYDETDNIQTIIRIEGMRNIVRQCGYDSRLIKHFLSKYCSKTNQHYYWNGRKASPGRSAQIGFKQILQQERSNRYKTTTGQSALIYINKFIELLKAS